MADTNYRSFTFATAGSINFGRGALRLLPDIAGSLTGSDPGQGSALHTGERRILVVGGASGRFEDKITQLLADYRLQFMRIASEPDVEMLTDLLPALRDFAPHALIGIGGGSVMDAAKALAALATNPGSPLDYLENVGEGRPLTREPLPLAAIPTTAGTGSEVTKNAVLKVGSHGVKVSLRHPRMLPREVIADPMLTLGLPPLTTAESGMDALTQLIEPYVSRNANPLTDALCRQGIELALKALPRAVREGDNPEFREMMSMASLMGGMALANAGLGAVHGFAGPLGGMTELGHGRICARFLAPVIRGNTAAARLAVDKGGEQALLARRVLERYGWIADRLRDLQQMRSSPDSHQAAEWLASAMEALVDKLGIPQLPASAGVPGRHDELVEKAIASSSMKANPFLLGRENLMKVLEDASGK